MRSIREIYKIGKGPSSSHTMGPERAARAAAAEYPSADRFVVTLYGSLAKTGRGHGTDRAITETLSPLPVEIRWREETQTELPHPTTMDFEALCGDRSLGTLRALSVGGGDIEIVGRPAALGPEVYAETSFAEISALCKRRRIRLSDYVAEREGEGVWEDLYVVWTAMQDAINEGLSRSGTLPGGLNVERRAQTLYHQRHMDERGATRENRLVCAYAFAVSEQNADLGTVVTAPTCGSCGVLPAVLRYFQEEKRFTDRDVLRALAAAGSSGIWSRPTPPSAARSAAVRRRWASPAPWRRPRWRSSSKWAWIRSSTPPRWRWSTIWG